jgi:hypothetical protein
MGRWRTDPDARFWRHVALSDVQDCWPWQAATTAKGYGIFKLDGRTIRAHRYAYALYLKVVPTALPADIEVHHTCERNECCNPNHMEAVDKTTHDRIHATDIKRRIK